MLLVHSKNYMNNSLTIWGRQLSRGLVALRYVAPYIFPCLHISQDIFPSCLSSLLAVLQSGQRSTNGALADPCYWVPHFVSRLSFAPVLPQNFISICFLKDCFLVWVVLYCEISPVATDDKNDTKSKLATQVLPGDECHLRVVQ